MNYYDELLENISALIGEKKYSEAKKLIENELKAPYIPRNIEENLKTYLNEISYFTSGKNVLSDEEIVSFLSSDNEHQLIAVDELNHRNLRDYIEVCNEYLVSDGFINAKVLLVDSLIRQEIGEDMKMTNNGIDYEFVPKYQLPAEETDGYLDGCAYLEDVFMKEPSKLVLSKELLYKESMMNLPLNLESEEGTFLAKQIENYVNKAFGDSAK